MKDGGVFVKFKYNAIEQDKALGEILSEVKAVCSEKGGTPTWTGMSSIAGDAWAVKGQPWREVSSQYFSYVTTADSDQSRRTYIDLHLLFSKYPSKALTFEKNCCTMFFVCVWHLLEVSGGI